METMLAHPDLQDLRRIFLATGDAHVLYARASATSRCPGLSAFYRSSARVCVLSLTGRARSRSVAGHQPD